MPTFPIPAPALAILRRLESAGHEAWAVGGCVRDCLLDLTPHDWDLCTSATPEQVSAALQGWPLIPTGLRHGTLTVRLEKQNWEVTTYRTDGQYTDHRHPDGVRFVSKVEEDLARRDFTVNAMAWHPDRGLFDPMGGQKDLTSRLLRCVGEPQKRFDEDALRILRGVRFAACYGLTPEEATAAAIHRNLPLLRRVAPERCIAELRRLLCAPADWLEPILRAYWDVLSALPGLAFLRPMEGYDQQNPHHTLDLKEHTIRAVVSVPPREHLRFAALLHDVGKPACRTTDEAGTAHFYGHPRESARMAERAFRALRCENALRQRVIGLIELHDVWVPPTPASARRWLGRLGEEGLRDLLALERGDTLAHAPSCQGPRLEALDRWEALLEQVLAEEKCFSLRDLAVKGDDLLAAGIPAGPGMGRALAYLLAEVQEGRLPNEREVLAAAALAYLQSAQVSRQDPR